ncbi:MAG: T9SS type A sorting domain-containing protein [Ignavibacteriaceae bacterium]|nr:T9SS type A sorting domain-containing protein [Ignavibacteriaceae bacterium]
MRITKLLMVFLLLSMMGFAQTSAPTNLKATLTSPTTMERFQVVSLTWDYAQTPSPSMVSFNIYKKMGALSDTTSFIKISDTFQKIFIDPQIHEGDIASYYVTAVINHIESDPSNKVEIEVVPPVIAFGKISGNLYDDSTKGTVGIGNVDFIPANDSMHIMDNFGMSVMTDSFGNFSARLRPGDYYMYSAARRYYGEFYDNVKTIQNATKITLNANDSLYFSIGLARIIPPVTYSVSGWVKDGSGNSLKAMLTAFITNRQHNPSCWELSYVARTDSQGNYQINGVKPGDTLVVYAEPLNRAFIPQYYNGKSTFETADRIGITGNVTDINFTLAAKPVYNNGISGTVKDSAGTTVVAGSVIIYKQNNNRFVFKGRAKTDTLTGVYSFTNLEPGQYILLAEGRGYVPSFFKYDGSVTMNWKKADSVVVTETSLVSDVNFFLKLHTVHVGGGFVFGTVRGNDGSTLPGSLNYIVDAGGDFVDYCVSDLDGSYMIGTVEAGSYTMVSSLVSFQDAQKTVSIDYTSNSTLNVDVSLSPNSTTGVSDKVTVVSGYELKQNYPNPFNPSTTITYQIPQNSFVSLKVYNILGNEVATLVNEQQLAGRYNFNFKANNLASGVYIYRLQAGSFISVRKLTLLK